MVAPCQAERARVHHYPQNGNLVVERYRRVSISGLEEEEEEGDYVPLPIQNRCCCINAARAFPQFSHRSVTHGRGREAVVLRKHEKKGVGGSWKLKRR